MKHGVPISPTASPWRRGSACPLPSPLLPPTRRASRHMTARLRGVWQPLPGCGPGPGGTSFSLSFFGLGRKIWFRKERHIQAFETSLVGCQARSRKTPDQILKRIIRRNTCKLSKPSRAGGPATSHALCLQPPTARLPTPLPLSRPEGSLSMFLYEGPSGAELSLHLKQFCEIALCTAVSVCT